MIGPGMVTGSIPRSPRRSLLFTPGDSIRKMRKVAQLNADTVILDLEDAVAVDQKEEAREKVATALSKIGFGRSECLVRINSPDTPWFEGDLEKIARQKLDGIVLPKMETADQLTQVDHFLSSFESANALSAGKIRLFALIETAAGILNVKEISQCSRRLDGLLFGAEDLAADLGATRTKTGWEIFHGRSAVITAAAAFRLAAIDTVFLDYNDLEGLEDEANYAKQLGFTGKMAIHPRQVEVINRVFSPSAVEIGGAERLVASYQSQIAAGSGAFTLDGHMVDRPMVKSAERLLERARLCRLNDEEANP